MYSITNFDEGASWTPPSHFEEGEGNDKDVSWPFFSRESFFFKGR
jgi:hypothetical protein